MKSTIFRITAILMAITLFLGGCTPAASAPTQAPVASVPTNPPAAATKVPEAAQKTVLTISHYWTDADKAAMGMKTVFDEFRQKYPDIDLQIQQDPMDTHTTLLDTAFLAGKEPDLTFLRGGDVIDRLNSGMLVPVDSYMKDWLANVPWYPASITNQTRNGSVSCFPWAGNTWPMWYNTKVLKASGVDTIPATMDEFITAAQKVRAAGYQPWAVGGTDWTGSHVLQFMLESRLGYDKTVKMFAEGGFSADADARSAIETFVKARDAGLFVDHVEGLTANDMMEMFWTDKVAFLSSGSWGFADIPAAMQDHIAISGLPVMPGSPSNKPTYWSDTGGLAFCLTRNGTKNLDAARKFVQFLYTEAHVAMFVEDTAMTPPYPVKVNEAKLSPFFKQSLDKIDELQTFTFTDPLVPPSVRSSFDAAAAQAFMPKTSADDILKALDTAYQNK